MPRFRRTIFILVLVMTPARSPAAQTADTLSLSGRWIDNGREVTIRQDGSGVIAEYVEPFPLCDPQDGSEPQPYKKDFEATLSGDSLSGKVTVCNWGESWGSEIGIQEADMRLSVSADGNTLSGTYEIYTGPVEMMLVRGDETPPDDGCAGARRALLQAESLLENHDARMNALASRYNELYGRLSTMSNEFQELKAAADDEWNEFRVDRVFEAAQNIVGAFLPFPPDQGSISAAQSVMGFYEFYQANSGTIAEMRSWSQEQGLRDIVGMLDHMDAMYEVMGRMTMLHHEYAEMEVERQPLEENVEDARRRLEDCMAVG